MPFPKNIKRAIYDKIKQADLLRMTGKTVGFRFIIIVVTAVVVGLSFILLRSGGVIPLPYEEVDIFTVVLGVLFISCLLIISAYYRRTKLALSKAKAEGKSRARLYSGSGQVHR